jgi:ATP-dependent DNA helicase Q4
VTGDPSAALEVLGFPSWREGQLEAVESILAGQSTMLILPTGLGKSLVFQALSLLLDSLVVVVCPLVSLIVDHMCQLPD